VIRCTYSELIRRGQTKKEKEGRKGGEGGREGLVQWALLRNKKKNKERIPI